MTIIYWSLNNCINDRTSNYKRLNTTDSRILQLMTINLRNFDKKYSNISLVSSLSEELNPNINLID